VKNTVKALAALLIFIMAASLIASCNGRSGTTDTESTTESEEGKLNPNDTYEGTLKITTSEDKKTATISYVLNGKEVTYTVPNNANYVCGGFAGTDDLGRTLPTSTVTGVYGENGEFYVGLFYFLWLGEHGDSGVYDMQKIIDKYGDDAKKLSCGAWGPEGAMHFFAEPLYGYYYSKDEWVMRKHMELLSNANIDFLYLDVTNGYAYVKNVKKLMKVCHELNEQGYDAPQIVFYTHTQSKAVIEEVYNEIYSKDLYPDTWFYVDGKPCIIADNKSYNINDFFTIRSAQWPNEAARKETSWPWMDFEWPQRIFVNSDTGVGEAISVSLAQHCGSVRFSSSALYGDSSNRGRSASGTLPGLTDKTSETKLTADSYKYGYNFQAQWDTVFRNLALYRQDPIKNKANNIKYVLVTGWNEWVAQRQKKFSSKEEIWFVDTASVEYSRDIEMTRGYYFDNYYMQLISNVQMLKGSAPIIIQDARNRIELDGGFEQWDKVAVKYTDPSGDCKNRTTTGFGGKTYTNLTGRNDIVSAKVTNDTKKAYFYVECAESITEAEAEKAWMQLFVNVDNDATNGWYGYDYVVNYQADQNGKTHLARILANEDKTWSAEIVSEISYVVEDNKMMISVPLEALGITDYSKIYVEFKWVDSKVPADTMERFYTSGDAAPLGRLNWIYQNYIPK
jgi:hypothetical protein